MTVTDPITQTRMLAAERDAIQRKIEEQEEILKVNKVDMNSSLVDDQGFPRSDIDIVSVRHARIRLIELTNDHKRLTESIAKSLEHLHQHQPVLLSTSTVPSTPSNVPQGHTVIRPPGPFAKVNAVAPESPAAAANLQREDLILEYGSITSATPNAFQEIARITTEHENVCEFIYETFTV